MVGGWLQTTKYCGSLMRPGHTSVGKMKSAFGRGLQNLSRRSRHLLDNNGMATLNETERCFSERGKGPHIWSVLPLQLHHQRQFHFNGGLYCWLWTAIEPDEKYNMTLLDAVLAFKVLDTACPDEKNTLLHSLRRVNVLVSEVGTQMHLRRETGRLVLCVRAHSTGLRTAPTRRTNKSD